MVQEAGGTTFLLVQTSSHWWPQAIWLNWKPLTLLFSDPLASQSTHRNLLVVVNINTFSYNRHPPHLTSSWSSVFIPFCAFKTKKNISQKSPALEGTNFPLWSSFLGGQLCFKLTLNETGGQGKIYELMFLLNYNEDRSLQVPSYKRNAVDSSNNPLNFDTAIRSIRGLSAKIQIDTLSP